MNAASLCGTSAAASARRATVSGATSGGTRDDWGGKLSSTLMTYRSLPLYAADSALRALDAHHLSLAALEATQPQFRLAEPPGHHVYGDRKR